MKAAIYIRVSTQEQAREGYSLAAQEKTLKEFCESKGLEVYKLYADEGISASSIKKREQLQKMMEDADEFDVVIIWKISRIARNMNDLLNVEAILRKKGVSLTSATEPFDTTTPIGKFIFQILGAVAEFEREIIAENISNALKEKTSQGKKNFTNLLGFDIRNQKVVPNKKEQKLVKLIFETYKRTQSLSETARIINNLGYKGLRGKQFAANSIDTIIINTNCIGILDYKGKEFYISKDFKGYIDVDLFLECQKIKLENGKIGSRGYEIFKERYKRLKNFISINFNS